MGMLGSPAPIIEVKWKGLVINRQRNAIIVISGKIRREAREALPTESHGGN